MDGNKFKLAVRVSDRSNDDIINSMTKSHGIKKSTFYRLYEKNEFNEIEKNAAAAALGKSVEEIFGSTYSKNDNIYKLKIPLFNATAGQVNEVDLSSGYSEKTKNEQNMMNKLLDMLQREIDNNNKRWDKLLEAHEQLIQKLPDAHEHPKAKGA